MSVGIVGIGCIRFSYSNWCLRVSQTVLPVIIDVVMLPMARIGASFIQRLLTCHSMALIQTRVYNSGVNLQ